MLKILSNPPSDPSPIKRRRSLMRLTAILIICCMGGWLAGQVQKNPPAPMQPKYEIGKAPRSEYHVDGKQFQIDPKAKATRQVRSMSGERFDPIVRKQHVEDFYHHALSEHDESISREKVWHVGPYRWEFVYWARHHWPLHLWALWAWHHRRYVDDALWAEWMSEQEFVNEINIIQDEHITRDENYLPAEYADIPTEVIYNDEFIDAAYNPVPLLAVVGLKNLKPDKETDWIAKVATDTLVSRLAAVPGLFVADNGQVQAEMNTEHLSDMANTQPAVQIGKALGVERVITGSYVEDSDKILFNLQVVEVGSGVADNGVTETIPKAQLLDDMPRLATSLTTALGYPTPASNDESAQADMPPTTTKATPEVAANASVHIVSKWRRYVKGKYDDTLFFYSNGRVVIEGRDYDDSTSTWSLNGDDLTIMWMNGGVFHGTMSSDGNSFYGKSHRESVRGERITDEQ